MAEMFHKSVIYTDVPSPHQPLEWHEEIKEKCCHDNMYIICHRANVGISDIITIVHKHILEGCAQSTLQIVWRGKEREGENKISPGRKWVYSCHFKTHFCIALLWDGKWDRVLSKIRQKKQESNFYVLNVS